MKTPHDVDATTLKRAPRKRMVIATTISVAALAAAVASTSVHDGALKTRHDGGYHKAVAPR